MWKAVSRSKFGFNLGAVQGGKGRIAIERKGKVETIVIAGLQHQGEGKTTRQANILCG